MKALKIDVFDYSSIVWRHGASRLESLGYILCTSSSLIVYVYPHSDFRGWLRKRHVFWNRVHNGPSGSSKVVDFGTNRKRVSTSYCSSVVILVLSCPVSEILQVFCWEERPAPVPSKFWGVPPDQIVDVLSPRSEDPELILVKLVSNYPNTYVHCSSTSRIAGRTDTQTDGRTTVLTIAIPR